MKIWSKFPVVLGVTGWMLASAWAGPAPPSEATAAIQAIQQASDPSAVVAAYANGVAIDRNDPKLFEAYVSRMVDLGLPELAYHQAQTLTTLQSNNGLGWGVVAYVNARRGDMPGAISAINLAGQNAPNNAFVQRTAGEIVAWYDLKADKSKLPDNAKEGLTKVRALLEKQPAFTTAYNTAKDAYQAQANAAQAPTPAAPSQAAPSQGQYGYAPQAQPQGDQVAPLGYDYAAAAPPPPMYYPPYYYDWGPNWVQPAPWWWWQPVGFFGGFSFFPFSTFLVFDNDDFFFHHHFHHDGFFHDHDFFHDHGFFHGHDQFFHHDGLNVAFHDSNHAFFHRDGQSAFFGTTARPDPSLATSARANFRPTSSFVGSGSRMSGVLDPGMRSTTPSLAMSRGGSFATSRTAMPQGMMSASRGNAMFGQSMSMRSSTMPRSSFGMRPPAFGGGMSRNSMGMSGFSGGMGSSGFRAPSFATAPHMSPHGMSMGGMSMGRSFGGGGFHGGGGGGFHGGGGGHR